MKLKEGKRMVDVVTTRNYNMEYWINAFQIPVDMYLLYMKQRKCRRKARYYKKLERLKGGDFK